MNCTPLGEITAVLDCPRQFGEYFYLKHTFTLDQTLVHLNAGQHTVVKECWYVLYLRPSHSKQWHDQSILYIKYFGTEVLDVIASKNVTSKIIIIFYLITFLEKEEAIFKK